MDFINVVRENGIAIVTLNRGKVNALNESFIDQLNDCFDDLRDNPAVNAIIFTGQGKFFSFGFDIPEFMSYSNSSSTVSKTNIFTINKLRAQK